VIEESGGTRFHKSGSLAGGRIYIEHRPDGIDWVMLLNGDGEVEGRPPAMTEIVDKLHRAMDSTRAWPDRDLFDGPVQAERPKGSVL
jgi:hypothetical protein